jgi:hypothetical protein
MLQKILKYLQSIVSFGFSVMEDNDKIILFNKYDSVIEANLAKTKLDAYGVPCFLTNEAVSALYPLPFMKGMEVGLFIFEADKERVHEIMMEDQHDGLQS